MTHYFTAIEFAVSGDALYPHCVGGWHHMSSSEVVLLLGLKFVVFLSSLNKGLFGSAIHLNGHTPHPV